jgi:hypothetical protein
MGCKAKKIFKNFAIAAFAPQRSLHPARLKSHRQHPESKTTGRALPVVLEV